MLERLEPELLSCRERRRVRSVLEMPLVDESMSHVNDECQEEEHEREHDRGDDQRLSIAIPEAGKKPPDHLTALARSAQM